MAKLAGHEFDLRALASLYNERTCRVAKDDDGAYYLTRDAFEAMGEAPAIYGAARKCIVLVNADMRLRKADYEPVYVEGLYRDNDDGSRSHYILLSGTLSANSRMYGELTVLGPSGQPVPSPEPARAQARLNLFERDERVREALDYSQRCNPGDADCLSYAYKVSEIILEDLGGGDAAKGAKVIASKGWSTDDEMQSFSESVHSREISGRKARHAGTRRAKPGVTPMSEDEVIAYIKRVLREWLNWKAGHVE